MKCPNCGQEIPEGNLLCEKCGAEINIVPDFEIDIENSINESLSGIVEDINPEYKKEEVEEIDLTPEKSVEDKDKKKSIEEKYEEEFFKEINISNVNGSKIRNLVFILLGIVIVLAVAVIIFLNLYKNYSFDYQLRQAKHLLKKSEYSGALSYIDRAYELDPGNKDALATQITVYIGMGAEEEAIELITTTLSEESLDLDDKIDLYERVIEIYISMGEYASISDLISNSNDEDIKEYYKEYLSESPVLSVPTGSYADAIEISIESCGAGKVYYSLDGSIPTISKSLEYSKPFTLESGEYDVKAVYVNSYGVESKITSCYYLIDNQPPVEPIVEPESGSFKKEFVLSVEYPEDCKVYYTDDGSDPDPETSLEYTKPINVTFGHYNYSFVCVSETGLLSNVVKRSYNVELETKVTSEMAQYQLIGVLNNLGFILDPKGTAPQNAGTYSFEYDSIVGVKSGYYYKFVEKITDSSGVTRQTGLLYAVDVFTLQTYRLTVDSSGKWGLIPLG